MKKAGKILSLILVVILVCGVLTGCAMFGKNASKYRALTAMEIGDEKITVGKVLDTFNNLYSNNQAYINAGYITLDSILESTVTSLLNQYMKVDSYVKKHTPENHAYAETYHNAGYLTTSEIEYCLRYIKYVSFKTFDSSVLAQLSVKREIKAAESEDTSRDFSELDKIENGQSYSEYLYAQNFVNEDMDEYFDKYYNGIELGNDTSVEAYVYTTEEAAKTIVDELNERLEEGDPISVQDYMDAQRKVVDQYKRSVKNTYELDFDTFVKNQVEDMVSSVIVAKYNYEVYSKIDAADNLNGETGILTTLQDNYPKKKTATANEYALKNNFVSFIENLSSSSYIYDVPQEYADSYVFVKNILIPFNDNQKAILTSISNSMGGQTTSDEYKALRNYYATKISGDDFTSAKDDDGKYTTRIENIFAIVGDELVIDQSGPLAKYFDDNGNVLIPDTYAGGTTKTDVIIDLMKKYNTDTAQHSAQYDYVVRVDNPPAGYKHNWVTEFVDATKYAVENNKEYALAVSEYGVHIIYISGKVQDRTFDFAANYLNASMPEYRLFKDYFGKQQTKRLNDDLEALKKDYVENNLIVRNKMFDRFLKDNNLSFDFDKMLKDED